MQFYLIFIYFVFYLFIYISEVFGNVETKSRQTLLRYKAIKIADYEALHHIHFWKHEPEPTYVCYIGQSKHFEEWYKNIKKCPIYKDLEEKSTFTKHVFKIADYDDVSIWKYKELDDIGKEIRDAEKMKKDFDDQIEGLRKKLSNIQEGKPKIDVQIEELRKKLNDIQEDKTKKDIDAHIEELCKINDIQDDKTKKEKKRQGELF